MRFEWDEEKNRRNIEKHGIGFRRASRIFEDEDVLTTLKGRNVGDERRDVAIGLLDGVAVIVVVYTERPDGIRIISARPASRQERRIYYETL